MAHDLAERGYLTSYFGKWHLGLRDPAAPLVGGGHARTMVPRSRRGGFMHWEGFESGFLLNDPWMQGTRLGEPVRLRGYQSDVLVDWTGDWVETMNEASVRRAPWFGVMSVEAPHPPYGAPAAGIKPREPAAIALAANVPRGGEVEARARRELAGYYAHIEATDRAIGRLLARLEPSTVVVITSVHGDQHGGRGLFRKGWPHEESVRVPLLVGGGSIGAARSVEPVSLLDLREMTGALADGRPWVCARESAPISMPSVVALPDQCDRVWKGQRSAARKRIFTADGKPWLEFDLLADPLEQRNLVEGHRAGGD